MSKKVRMSDIAEVLGVSNVTISKALGNKDGVSDELRQKIIQTAQDMGYQYSRTEEVQESYNIGIIVAQHYVNSFHSFYWTLYQNVVEALKTIKSYCILEIVPQEDEDHAILPDFVSDDKICGFIVLGKLSTDYLKKLQEIHKPIVLTDFYDDLNITAVNSDNYNDSCKITDYLIQKGHRQIGFVGSIYATSSIQDRYLGYLKSLIKNNIEIHNEWIIPDRHEGTLDFLQEFELPQNMPTAFVCNCDQTAYYFIQYLLKKGYKVPDDISVVGYYNFVFATMCQPELTTIQVDLKVMAKESVMAILRLKKYDAEITHLILKGEIIERESVKTLSI